MCDCKSYNNPELGGGAPEVILDHAKYFPDTSRPTICVDACIADAIEALWAAGVRTGGCCCGHNGKVPFGNGKPSVILEDASQSALASDVLKTDSRDWFVCVWAGGAN